MVDTINENGLSLAYSNITKKPSHEMFIFNKEKPPPECLGEPYINEEAKNLLADDMKWLASKEALLSLAMMTVSRKDTQASKILTQIMSGRTTVVRHGQIEFADNIGGMVIEKGGWVSGKVYDEMYEYYASDSNSVPWGLFGAKESIREARLSTALINNGFRAALSLGYIPLNSNKTREWLLKKFEGDKYMRSYIDRSFAILEENKDVPVLDFRVGGVEYRIGTSIGETDQYHFSAFLAHSSRLLTEEIKRHPEKYKKYLTTSENIDNYLTVLGKVEKKSRLNGSEFINFFDIYMAIGRKNADSLREFLKQRKDLNMGLSHGFLVYLHNGSLDTCCAGFSYDFEQVEISKPEADDLDWSVEEKIPQDYLESWYNRMRSWLFEGQKYLVSKDSVTGFGLFTKTTRPQMICK